MDILRRKHVLLLISDLDISHDEIQVLEFIYKGEWVLTKLNYEIIWLPIVDRSAWNDNYEQKFLSLRSIMPWYTVDHPSIIEPAVIKYTREVWRFVKKPIVVTLDPQGKVTCPNALNMLWIWRSTASHSAPRKKKVYGKKRLGRLNYLLMGLKQTCLFGYILTYHNTLQIGTHSIIYISHLESCFRHRFAFHMSIS